jgi:hypothetical protein
VADAVGNVLVHLHVHAPCVLVAEETDVVSMDVMIRAVRIARTNVSSFLGLENPSSAVRFMIVKRRILQWSEFVFGTYTNIPDVVLSRPLVTVISSVSSICPFEQYGRLEYNANEILKSICTYAYELEVSTIPSHANNLINNQEEEAKRVARFIYILFSDL